MMSQYLDGLVRGLVNFEQFSITVRETQQIHLAEDLNDALQKIMILTEFMKMEKLYILLLGGQRKHENI